MYQDHDLGSPQLIHLLTTGGKKKVKIYYPPEAQWDLSQELSTGMCSVKLHLLYLRSSEHTLFFFKFYALIKYCIKVSKHRRKQKSHMYKHMNSLTELTSYIKKS